MFELRFHQNCEPRYMTEHSAACDLLARDNLIIKPGEVVRVPSGVWISSVDWDQVPSGMIPELQIRARSGLAMKHSICLANGIGTVDADYRDEIGILLINHGKTDFFVEKGDRIAQMALAFVGRLQQLEIGGERRGGFGSTAVK